MSLSKAIHNMTSPFVQEDEAEWNYWDLREDFDKEDLVQIAQSIDEYNNLTEYLSQYKNWNEFAKDNNLDSETIEFTVRNHNTTLTIWEDDKEGINIDPEIKIEIPSSNELKRSSYNFNKSFDFDVDMYDKVVTMDGGIKIEDIIDELAKEDNEMEM